MANVVFLELEERSHLDGKVDVVNSLSVYDSMRREKFATRHLSAAGLRKVTIRPVRKNNQCRQCAANMPGIYATENRRAPGPEDSNHGATGKIAFPIARALAKQNEVWVPRASASLQTGTNSVAAQFIHFDSTCRAANSRNCLTTSRMSSMPLWILAREIGVAVYRPMRTTPAGCCITAVEPWDCLLLDGLHLSIPGAAAAD